MSDMVMVEESYYNALKAEREAALAKLAGAEAAARDAISQAYVKGEQRAAAEARCAMAVRRCGAS